tara:strand:- start:272 stop:622 length:351 start_codon:yes stop_codon:yes gene_type:complete
MLINELKKKIKQNNNLFIIFTAEWCRPCRKLKPIIADKKVKYKNNIKFLFLTIDDNEDIATLYKIKYIPTIIVYHNQNELEYILGDIKEVEDKLDNYIQIMQKNINNNNINLQLQS